MNPTDKNPVLRRFAAIILTFLFSAGVGVAQVSSFLRAHYDFDSDGSEAAGRIDPFSAASLDAAAVGDGVTFGASGIVGTGAVDLDDSEDYLWVDGDASGDQTETGTAWFDFSGGANGTISIWINTEGDFTEQWEALIAKGDGTGDWRVHRNSTGNEVRYNGSIALTSTTTVNDTDWHSVVVTITATGERNLYIDGILEASATGAANLVDGDKDLLIGYNPDQAGREFGGQIDDVGLWGRALGAQEVAVIHALGRVSGVDLEDVTLDAALALTTPGETATVGSDTWEYITGLSGTTGTLTEPVVTVVLDDVTGHGLRLQQAAGVYVDQSAATAVEGGSAGTYNLQLFSNPASTVTITASAPTGMQISADGVTFGGTALITMAPFGTAAAPLVPVYYRALDDSTVEPPVTDQIVHAVFVGDGGDYTGALAIDPLAVTILDAPVPNVGEIAVYNNVGADPINFNQGETAVTRFSNTAVAPSGSYVLDSDGEGILMSAGKHLVIYGSYVGVAGSGASRLEILSNLALIDSVSGVETDLVEGQGQGYIRCSSGVNECLISGGAVIDVANPSSVLRLKNTRTDSNATRIGVLTPGQSSIQLLKLDDNLDVLKLELTANGTAAATEGGAYEDVVYDQTIGTYTGSMVFAGSSADVTLTNAGHYLVLANTRLQKSSADVRTNYSGQLTLDGVAVQGSKTTTYMRSLESTNDGVLSVGMIIEATAGQLLNIEQRKDDGETATIIGAETTLTVIALPGGAETIRLEDTSGQAINPAARTPVVFGVQAATPAPVFTHSTLTNPSEVTVNAADNFLFFGAFHDNVSETQRAVPEFLFQRNGTELVHGGASQYGRKSGGSDELGNWLGMMTPLAAGDVVELSTLAIGAAGTATGDSMGLQGVRVSSLSSAPILVVNDTLGATASSSGSVITNALLLTSDSDTPATSLTYTLLSAPTGGSLRNSGAPLTSGGTFTQDDVDQGLLTFDAGATTGSFHFTFTVSDGSGTASGVFMILLVDPLILAGDTAITDEDTAISAVNPAATASLLANDSGDGLSVTSFDALSANGAKVNVNPDGTFSYDPAFGTGLRALGSGDPPLADSFTYTVTDSIGSIDTATVTVTVSGINDTFAAVGDQVDDPGITELSGASVSIDLTVNDGIVSTANGTTTDILMLNYDAAASAGAGRWENLGYLDGANGPQDLDWIMGNGITLNTGVTSARAGITAAYEWDGSIATNALYAGSGGDGIGEIAPNGSYGAVDLADASFEFWAKLDAADMGQITCIFETGGGTGFGILVDNGVLKAATETDGGTEIESFVSYDLVTDPLGLVGGDPTAEFNQYGLAIRVGGGGLSLFVNGVLVDETTSGTGTDWEGGDANGIGRFQGDNFSGFQSGAAGTLYDTYFNGSIAVMRAYAGALTTAEFVQNYNAINSGGIDAENDALSVSGIYDQALTLQGSGSPAILASGGVVTLNAADGSFSYNPTGIPGIGGMVAGEVRYDSFVYQAVDGNGESAEATVTVAIHGVNQAAPSTLAASELIVTNFEASRIVGNADHGIGAANPYILLDANDYSLGDTKLNYDGQEPSWALNYEAEVAPFNVGATVTGGTSGATGVIAYLLDYGGDGVLFITGLSGNFQDNEAITDNDGVAPGSATVNGAETANPIDFVVGQMLTGTVSGATGTIAEVNDNGAAGSLILTGLSGTFQDNELIIDGVGAGALANGVTINVWQNRGSSGPGWDVTLLGGSLVPAESNFAAIGSAFENIEATMASLDSIATYDMTFEIWFKPDFGGSGKQLLFETGGSTTGTSLAYDNNTGIVTFKTDAGNPDMNGNNYIEVNASGITPNEFNHLVAIYDRDNPGLEDTLTLYVNNSPTSFTFAPNAVSPTPNPTGVDTFSGTDASAIGNAVSAVALNEGGFSPFQGQVAMMRVYSRKLTIFEILGNYNAVVQPITQLDDNPPSAPGSTIVTSTLGATVTLNADRSVDYDASSLSADIDEDDVVQDFFTYTISDGVGTTTSAVVTVDVTGVGTFFAIDDTFAISEDSFGDVFDPLANDLGGGTATLLWPEIDSEYSFDWTDGFTQGEAADFSGTTGWRYMWNAPSDWNLANTPPSLDGSDGALGNEADYELLVWDDIGFRWTVDGDDDNLNGLPGPWIRLTSTGGHPGDGSAESGAPTLTTANVHDRAVIAAYTVTSDGTYAIDESTITSTDAPGGFEVKVYVNDTLIATTPVSGGSTRSFDVKLGELISGDDVYIAVSPAGNNGNDSFSWDFNLIKLPAPDSELISVIGYIEQDFGDPNQIFYDPEGQFESLPLGQSVFETITYTIDDGAGKLSTASFTVEVQGANDLPTGFDDSYVTAADVTLNGDVSTNDTDIDQGESLTTGVFEVQGTTGVLDTNVGVPVATDNGGTVTVQADGTFAYTPPAAALGLGPNESIADSFNYVAKDEHDLAAEFTALVSITVNGTEDGVVATPNAYAAIMFGSASGNLITDDTGAGTDSTIDTDDLLSVLSVDTSGGQGQVTSLTTPQVVGVTGATQVSNVKQTIVHGGTFTNPVVIVGPPDFADAEPAVARVTNVTATSFDLEIVEQPELAAPAVSDGDGDTHPAEWTSWVVLEAGQYVMPNGALLEAGTVDTIATAFKTGGTWETVNFSAPFTTAPIVMSSTQTDDQQPGELMNTRLNSAGGDYAVTTTSFQIALCEWEFYANTADSLRTVPETIGWMAIEPGAGISDGQWFEAGLTGQVADETWDTLTFAGTYPGAVRFLANSATFAGQDPLGIRRRNLGSTTVEILGQEDQTLDAELGRTAERVTWFAIGDSGELSAFTPGAVQGAFTYEPGGALAGLTHGATTVDTFTYTLTDGKGSTSTETVTVTVTGVNAPPVAANIDQTLTLPDGTPSLDLGDIVVSDPNGVFSRISTLETPLIDHPATHPANYNSGQIWNDGAGFSLDLVFSPDAADVTSGNKRTVFEVGGTSNGHGIYLVDGVPHFICKMNSSLPPVPTGLTDTDWGADAGGTGVVSVPLGTAPLPAGAPTQIALSFDLDSVSYSVNGSVVATIPLTNRTTQTNWSGDDTVGFGSQNGDAGGLTKTTAGPDFFDMINFEVLGGSLAELQFWNGTAPDYLLDVNPTAETVTATLTLDNPFNGTISGLTALGGAAYGVTGTVAEVNAALASAAYLPSVSPMLPVIIAVSIDDGNEDASAPATGTITITPDSAYLAWVAANYPGTGDFDQDDDGDGTINGFEWYFFNSDPLTATGGGSPLGAPTVTAEGIYTFSHVRPSDRTGLSETYQWSTDMENWLGSGDTDGTNTVDVLEVPGSVVPDTPTIGYETVTIEVFTNNLPAPLKLHARLLLDVSAP